MKLKCIMSLILCLVMVLTFFVSCISRGKDDASTQSGTSDQSPEETIFETDERGFVKDNLPEKTFDSTLNLYFWDEQDSADFNRGDETPGELVEKIYYRSEFLYDAYGIGMNVTFEKCLGEDRDKFIKRLMATMNESTGESFDAIGCPLAVSGMVALKGFYEDLSDKEHVAPYIDLSKPWWSDEFIESTSIGGKVYTVTGDITPTFNNGLSVCAVNNAWWKDFYSNEELVYDLIKNKTWTYDKLLEVSSVIASTIRPDLYMPSGSTVSSITISGDDVLDNILASAGFRYAELEDGGSVKVSDLAENERFADFFEFCSSFTKNKRVKFTSYTEDITEGKAFIHFGTVGELEYILSKGYYHYGIAPYPMYTTADHSEQTEYQTSISRLTTVYGITPNCKSNELASFTLEALASYGYRWITPAWFKEAFPGYNMFTEIIDTFDIITDSVVVDVGYMLDGNLNCIGTFGYALKEAPDWAVYSSGKITDWNSAINEINSTLG